MLGGRFGPWRSGVSMERAVRLLDLRRMIWGHPLDTPKLEERRPRSTGKRSNAPLLWLRTDGTRRPAS